VAGHRAGQPLIDKIKDAVDERERDDESDEQAADGVCDAATQLVEMLEEGHPPFGGFLIVIERREAAGLFRKILPIVVPVLAWKGN
jgi:hypothetical protein